MIDSENLCKTHFLLGKDLTRWNKVSFGKVEAMIQKTERKLENLRYLKPNEHSISKEIELNEKLEEFLCREEDLWRQKSRELWLKGGDKNTKFLHASTINRRKNRIKLLKNPEGIWPSKREEIGNELCNHLSKLMSTSGNKDFSTIQEVIKPVLDAEVNEKLISIPSYDEVRDATFQIGALKAPSCNGYPAIFYQHMWESIANDITISFP